MSSVWLLVSNSAPVADEGFHVDEESARRRLAEMGTAATTYSVVEVKDTVYEIHRGGQVPDVVWVFLEDGMIDPESGYRVTRASAREHLSSRDDAAYENWEFSEERAEGMRLADYLRECWEEEEAVRLTRHSEAEQSTNPPSPEAVRLLRLIRHETDLPEPVTSVRGDLVTYTWEHGEDVVVDVRVDGSRWVSTVVHRPNARPSVRNSHEEDIPRAARHALGVPAPVDLSLYTQGEFSDLDV